MTQVSMTSAALSDVGLRRKENQDGYLVSDGLFLVADGMGGGVSGQEASATALQAMSSLTTSTTRTREAIDECFSLAQQQVRELGKAQDAVAGTTMTGLILKDLTTLDPEKNAWYVVNVGDSRTYHLNAVATSGDTAWDSTSFMQITHDHSERQEAIDSGRLLPQIANQIVPRNIITQAVGSPNGIAPDYFRANLPGRFIICSDGVHSELSDASIAHIASQSLPPKEIAHQIVNSALKAGGHDNTTVIVVDVTLPRTGSDDDAPVWGVSTIGPGEDIDSMNDSTLETLRTTRTQEGN